ncbi:MAG: M18 family aminopeptidase, partial [Ruminococcaceae bacterium]|nr:M18 family aminopeptidase [Oscillospiraceae bacterium]
MGKTERLLNFIGQSPTAFEAVVSVAEVLEKNGFSRLLEGEEWALSAGHGYFVTRNDSSLIAFRVPTCTPRNFLITASHTDSPMFKLKHEHLSFSADGLARLNTEVYGGAILSSWMDRPLSLAGRAVLCREGVFTSHSVVIDRDLLIIPNVAIHFNRAINTGYNYNPAVDMLPLFSEGKETDVLSLVAAELGCVKEEIVGTDLYVYNRMAGTVLGAENEFFSAPRIDDLMCVWGSLEGFVASRNEHSVNVLFVADNEETGSATKQGAGSVYLSDTLERVCMSLGCDRRRMLVSSMMVSADNAHAKHPNHPELSDVQNAPRMNGGVVIKFNAAQKYTTDGLSAAIFERICQSANVPVQYYANRSDMAGGSTLGSISTTHVPLLSV